MTDYLGERSPGSFSASLMPGSSPIQMPLYDGAAGEGEGDPAAAAAAAAAGAGGGDPNDPANASGGVKPVAGTDGAKGAGGEKTFSFKEDRADWIPRTRLNEEGAKFKKSQDDNTQLKADLVKEQARVRAALGIDKADPKAAETEELRGALHEMFPQLKAFEGMTSEQIAEIFDAANTARSASKATWDRHASEMFDSLEGETVKALGVEKLSQTQVKRLHQAYREEAYAAVQARPRDEQGNPLADPTGQDFLTRHERGDKKLIEEFVKTFLDDWFEPAKKSVTLSNARKFLRPTPQGGRTVQPLVQGEKKVDLTDDAAFKKALIEARGASG